MDHARHQLDPTRSEPDDSPEVLRGKIQQTRAEIGETVNTLQERLSPERVKKGMKTAARQQLESAKEQVRCKAEQWQMKAAERMVNNPLPTAMVGIGLLWLWKRAASATREQDPRYQNYYSLDPGEEWPDYAPERPEGRIPPTPSRQRGSFETMKANAQASGQQAREQISEWTSQAQDSLEDWKSRTSYRTGQIQSRMRESGKRAKGEFNRYLQENPLTVGAITLAMGTAVGLSLPRSRQEDQWLGEARDRLFEEAKATVNEIMPKAKEVAGEYAQAARTAVQNQTGMK